MEELKEKLSDPFNYFTSYKEIHQWLGREHNVRLSYEHVHRFVHQYLGAKLKRGKEEQPEKNPALEEKYKKTKSTTGIYPQKKLHSLVNEGKVLILLQGV